MTKQPKMTFLEGTVAIKKSITSIAKRGKALDKDIHVVAVSTLAHADKHGDITLCLALVEALPASTRKNALKDWLIAFGRIKYDAETKALVSDKTKTTNLQEAIKTPFWEFKPEAEYKPFNAIEAVTHLLKRAQSAKEKGDNVPDALVNMLNDFIQTQGQPTKASTLKKAA